MNEITPQQASLRETLPQAVWSTLAINIVPATKNHSWTGWLHEGTAGISCQICATDYELFSRSYKTTRGTYTNWALVCTNCKEATPLESFSPKVVERVKADTSKSRVGGNKSTKVIKGKKAKSQSEPHKSPNPRVKPTDEQLSVVSGFGEGLDLRIQALAGTGKTTTLSLAAASRPSVKCQYIAFNKAIVEDARTRFGANVNCSTAHSLAFRDIGKNFKHRLDAPRVRFEELANVFQCPSLSFSTPSSTHALEPRQVARYAKITLDNFVKSLSTEVDASHIPRVEVIAAHQDSFKKFVDAVLPVAIAMWQDLQELNGFMKFEHDHYLKLWQLSRPTINCDAILFDEAQDADPVMLDVVNSQPCQVVYCGDSFQAVYEWRGAVNALELVHTDSTLWLTESFRFGQAIAHEANMILNLISPKAGRLVGQKRLNSYVGRVDAPDAIMCRTNAGVVHALLMQQATGRRPALLGPVRKSLLEFGEGCRTLQQGGRSGHPELAPFADWAEVSSWIEENADDGSELSTLGRVVKAVGVDNYIAAIAGTVDEQYGDVLVSTVHRTKGREWGSVQLGGDFKHPIDMDEDELKIVYVACTRAKEQLDQSNLPSNPGDKPVWWQRPLERVQQPVVSRKPRPPISPSSSNSPVSRSSKGGIWKRLRGES